MTSSLAAKGTQKARTKLLLVVFGDDAVAVFPRERTDADGGAGKLSATKMIDVRDTRTIGGLHTHAAFLLSHDQE